MSGKDRKKYSTATVLDQDLLDWSQDNLECRLELAAEIESPTGIIYASDRNKYVGDKFYEALLVFPVISRTVGDWLAPELSFSTLTLELSNADGRFNSILPGGVDYGSWIGKEVTVRLGLAEIESTYKTIYQGTVTEVGGIKRGVKSITLVTRDRYDRLSASMPTESINRVDYPKVDDDVAGKLKPVIYGDFTVALDPEPAIVPGLIVNGRDPSVNYKDIDVEIVIGTHSFTALNHCLDNGDKIQFTTSGTLPTGLAPATDYYVISAGTDTFQVSASSGGPLLTLSGGQSGSHTFKSFDPRTNIKCLISTNDLTSLDASNIWMLRSESYYKVDSSDIVSIGSGNKTFEVVQNTANLWVSGEAYLFDTQDKFFVRCKGKSLSGYDDNIIAQAKDILKTYGGVVDGDFDTNWTTYRDKSSPTQSAISTFKSRVYAAEETATIVYVLSMLEQVRLEAFIDRNQRLKINSLHFEDFVASPNFTVKNWDVVKDSFTPQLDEVNNFNRAQGTYDFHPDRNENAKNTAIYKNAASISQVGKAISKRIVFPNLYMESDVVYNLKEILRLASSMFESVGMTLTWRSMLLDIGDFVSIDVKIGSVDFENVPAMIRVIGADPDGLKIPVKVWSFAMAPFPGYEPGYTGTVGGYSAVISQE
jgi:hypothetical protein